MDADAPDASSPDGGLSRRADARRQKWRRVRLLDGVDLLDPVEMLEAMRGVLIRRLVEVADATPDDTLESMICLQLLRMSSLGRTRVDVTVPLAVDPAMADALRGLTVVELERLIAGPGVVPALALPSPPAEGA